MALNAGFVIVVSGISLVANTPKTAIMLISSGTGSPVITEFGVGFGGVDASQAPIWVDLVALDQTTAGTFTSFTPLAIRPFSSQPSISIGRIVYTAEPTNLVLAKPYMVSPNGGQLVIQFPLGREPWNAFGATTSGKGVGIRLTNPVGNNTVQLGKAYIEFEE